MSHQGECQEHLNISLLFSTIYSIFELMSLTHEIYFVNIHSFAVILLHYTKICSVCKNIQYIELLKIFGIKYANDNQILFKLNLFFDNFGFFIWGNFLMVKLWWRCYETFIKCLNWKERKSTLQKMASLRHLAMQNLL